MKKRILVFAALVLLSLNAYSQDAKKLIGGWSDTGAMGPATLGFFSDGTMFFGEYMGTYSVKNDTIVFDLIYGQNLGYPREFHVSDDLLLIAHVSPGGRLMIKSYVRVAK